MKAKFTFYPCFIVFLSILCTAIPIINYVADKNNSEKIVVCFTPGEDCEGLFVNEIDKANKTLDIQEYHLNNKAIVAAVLRAKARGVVIRMILDKVAKKEAIPFVNAGIPVLIDYKPRIAHNKVMIVDGRVVIGGSFNPTESAQKRNAENLLIMEGDGIARQYEGNFEKRLRLSIALF